MTSEELRASDLYKEESVKITNTQITLLLTPVLLLLLLIR